MSEPSTDLLGVLVSEGYGIFTQVTSILNSLTQTTSTPTTATSSFSSSSSSPTDASASPTSSAASETSSSSSQSLSGSLANSASSTAAAASSTPSPIAENSGGGGGNGNHNKLAIILGSVLGALALGLLILAILLCCRRKRRRSRKSSVRSSALLPGDDEVDGWRKPNHFHGSHYSSSKDMVDGGVPFLHDHAAYRQGHDNPFVPVPPPPRRSAPNSRAGLTDGTVPGDDPYLMEKGTGRPVSLGRSRSRSNSSQGKALAFGAGGVALGAAAMHSHSKTRDSSDDDMANRRISRKPVPVKSVNGGEAWPYEPPAPIHDNGVVGGIDMPSRESFDSGRSRPSRDAARANATFDQEYNMLPNTNHEQQQSGAAKTATALGVGAAGGAAFAHHRSRDSRHHPDSDSGSLSQNATLVAAYRQQSSDVSNTSSDSNRYSDAMTRQQPGVHELPSNIPPTPPARERHNSALGAAAPAAAVGSYFGPPNRHRDRSKSRSRSRSHSSTRPRSFPEHPDDYSQHRIQPQPPVPSRSPARHSFTPSSAAGPSQYGDIPISYDPRAVSPPYESKALVGDNGYPHMNVPRRKSGGEYDYSHNGAMGPPATMSPRPSPLRHSSEDDSASQHNSDDSTWRLSMGMPGGWQRTGAAGWRPGNSTPRGSLDGWASPVSPVGGNWEGGRGVGRLRRSQLAESQQQQQRGGYEEGGYVSGVGQAL